MSRFFTRQLAATMVLSISAALTASVAGEAPKEEFDAPPPMPYTIPAKTKDFIKKAIENPARTEEMKVHDYYRKPAEVLTFANFRQGMRVVEMSSYGNYWSMLLSETIGPKGELYMYDPPFAAPLIKRGEAFVAKHPNSRFQNVEYDKIEFPKGIDIVWCYACFHELLLTNTQMDAFLAKLYKNMKPGGVFMIIFYTSRDGMENRETGTLHRVDPATVRGTIQAAGFTLSDENRVLENHDDDQKTQVFTEKEGDLSDRLIYRFLKR